MLVNLLHHLSEHRAKLYGIAALLVILFHASGQVYWAPLQLFAYGYIGVDIFLFIGSFCLCYSIQKYTIKEFYIKRFLRIYPLWFFVAILACPLVSHVLNGTAYSLMDILKLIYGSTIVLPIWTGRGGCDWFTASLIHYYLLFPWLWRWSRKIGSIWLYVALFLLCFCLVATRSLIWTQDCGISKLPIFMLGIIAYDAINGNKKPLFFCLLLSVIGLSVAIWQDYMFLKTAMICPFIILLFLAFFEFLKRFKITTFVFRPFELLGDHSMESYYGGWLSYLWVPYYYPSLLGAIIYVTQTFVLTFIWSISNAYIGKLSKLFMKKDVIIQK